LAQTAQNIGFVLISTPKTTISMIHRRRFLKGAAYSLALPFLPSIAPRSAFGKTTFTAKAKRLVCIGTQLGFYKPNFFANEANPSLLAPLDAAGLSKDFTTISGLSEIPALFFSELGKHH
jgi:hypothetical protein|tara:strand:- start:72 stop:431 length:360 start_codon:yes stop_codon:yes gene_type:complete